MLPRSKSALSLRYAAVAAFAAAAAISAVDAKPKVNAGSRGTKTDMPVPPTRTAPAQAQPIGKPAQAAPAAAQTSPRPVQAQPAAAPAAPAPAAAAPAPAPSIMPALAGAAAGVAIGATVTRKASEPAPVMTGSATEQAQAADPPKKGFFASIGAFLFSKTMLILLLLAGLGAAVYAAWKRGMLPQMAAAGVPLAVLRERMGKAPLRQVSSGAPAAAAAAATGSLKITEQDFTAFERALMAVMDAYSRESSGEIRMLARPSLAVHFEEEIAENARRGFRNQISDVKLMQGDLAEAWSEDGTDYATVAMRFSLIDTLLDRNTGQPAPGHQALKMEATEVWTFARENRGSWKLSAIQQAGK